jgi:membrane fusion protein, multidrug efflux system
LTVDTTARPITDPGHQLPAHGADSPQHKTLWIILGILFLLLLVLAIVLFWGHDGDAKKGKPVAPKVNLTGATATKGDIGVYLDAIGTVTPVYTASIVSQVNGIVLSVHYKEGQLVRKGDPLIDIDSRTYRANLLQAQGALERDESVLAQAKMDLDRYRDAWSRNAIAKQILDDQEKLVLQDEGTVKNDRGVVQFDEVQVEYCHITSPITGRVGLRLVDPGNVVQSSGGTTLAVITQLTPITAIFTIPEDSLGPVADRLRKNAKLDVDAFDRTGQTKIASGKLLTIDNQIDTTTGTVKGRSVFDNSNNALFPNQFVNTRLLVTTLQGVTLIPASTIQQNGQTSFVYVIQNSVAHKITIKPGVTDGGITQVEGINPGDVVANSSFDKLQENTPVNIVAPNGGPANGSGGGNGDGQTNPPNNPQAKPGATGSRKSKRSGGQ